MSETPTPPGNPEVHHEYSDVNVRGIVLFGVSLLVLAAIVHVVLWWMFDHFFSREAALKRSGFPLAAELRGQLPPAPRLEGILQAEGKMPYVQPQDSLPAAQERLQSYGWVNRQQETIHIPIDLAMRLVEQDLARTRKAKQEKTP